MSKTVIKDNSINSDDNVDDSISVSSEVDSDNESIISDFSEVDDFIGIQQQTGVIPSLQPAVPVRAGGTGRPGRIIQHPPNLNKKTRSGKNY